MHTYLKSEDNLWTVGFYDSRGKWRPESDHDSEEQAISVVNRLNGGSDQGESELQPIKPSIMNEVFRLDPIIEYMNNAILERDFHLESVPYDQDYCAFIYYPYRRFPKNVLDRAIEKFREYGWDCFWKDIYDVRGPHTCFYVHKKHFPELEEDPSDA